MTSKSLYSKAALLLGSCIASFTLGSTTATADIVYKAGDPSLKPFILGEVPYPKGNKPTPARIKLGKKLFFDPRLSGDGNMSCATCHNPMLGWSDGLPTAKGHKSKVLGRASPVVTNAAYNPVQMWDGREPSIDSQATGPMKNPNEMHTDIPAMLAFINATPEYKKAFANAYPGEELTLDLVGKAIASFERTVISNDSPFDRWVKGDAKAMTKQQIRGFKLFMTPEKGNCALCHSGPNFTDSSFHNLGLASFGKKNPDLGRYKQRPLGIMKGAFKTPTIRDITLSAPYFHDGSAKTLMEVVDHYVKGGVVKTNLSPLMIKAKLNNQEQKDLVAFMEALTTEPKPFDLPILPLSH